ncbi:MAG: hypothetical protein JW810_06285, partial [Sedimentisphaerales bacterium]|nr:hypothetical protein [Sedimentisphaerales bacterium]
MAGKTVIALAVGVLLTVNATVRAYTADDYIQAGRQSMFDRTLTGLRTAHEIYSQGLEDPQCGDCATDRQLHFLHALARTYMLLVRDDGGALDSAWELAEAFGATVEGDRFFPFEMSGAIALNEQGEYEIPPTAPDADELQTMLEEFTLPELAAILAELDLISESPGDPFVIYLTPAETGLGDDLEVDYGDVLVFRALVAGAKGVLEAESAYDIFVDPNDPLVEHLYQDNLSVNDDLLGRYPGLLKVLPTPGHPADGTAILAQARQDLIAGIDAYFEAVAYILAEEDDQQNDLLYIETGDRRTFDQVQMVLGKLRDSLTTDTPITEPTTTIETYAVRDEQDTERGQLQLEFGPFGEGQGGYLDLIADTGLPSSWFVEDFSIWGDELIAEVVLDESREPPYTGWHNLTNAPSVLFEPTGPDDYLVTILDESLFVAGGTAQNWHGDETTWTYALPFSFP